MKAKDITILLVDDEPDILEILSYNLSNEGYNIETTDNGAKAVKLAKKIKPQLIILDVMMPGEDGVAFEDASIVDALSFETLAEDAFAAAPEGRLDRFRFDPTATDPDRLSPERRLLVLADSTNIVNLFFGTWGISFA